MSRDTLELVEAPTSQDAAQREMEWRNLAQRVWLWLPWLSIRKVDGAECLDAPLYQLSVDPPEVETSS